MNTKPELKIIADHLRSSCFLIADGVLPSNEGRGYVLRRIMRRAMLQLHKLGARQVSMFKLVDVLINEMGAAYPELSRARAVIIETLKNEEEKFRETLEKGFEIIEKELEKSETVWTENYIFSGKTAFKLYDTYGFPLDLTQIILQTKGIKKGVNVDEFNEEMENQRTRARANWKGSGESAEETIFFDLKEKHGETKFLGYETLESKAKVLAVFSNFIILDQTPFYATSGGQKGDEGTINEIEISETKKFAGGLFAHFFSDQKCSLKEGDEVVAKVNEKNRKSRAANHSATHLMHKALKEVLGNSISQKGSNVDANYFTFDFNFNRAMTAEEIQKVEDLVNTQIKNSANVNTKLMNLEEAKNSGAEALFGEKYDAKVRVVSMGNSVELCGGTHVKNTSDIEIFKIISEKSVASGIRRIEAKSSESAKEYLEEQKNSELKKIAELQEKIALKNSEILSLNNAAKIDNSYQNEVEIQALEEILKKKDKEIEALKKSALLEEIKNLKSEKIADKNFLHHNFDDIDGKIFRDIATEIKNKPEFKDDSIIILFNQSGEMANAAISVSANITNKFNANDLLKIIGGKGGGKPDFVTGGGIKKTGISEAVKLLKESLS